MTTTHYFVHDQLLGSADIPQAQESHAFWCSSCGEVWARIVTCLGLCYIHQVPCERHQPQFVAEWVHVPGSLLRSLTQDLAPVMDWARALELMPEGILKWEFKVHLAFLLREESQEQQEQAA